MSAVKSTEQGMFSAQSNRRRESLKRTVHALNSWTEQNLVVRVFVKQNGAYDYLMPCESCWPWEVLIQTGDAYWTVDDLQRRLDARSDAS